MSNRIICKPEKVKSDYIIYPVLAIILLVALLPMPYGYYTFTRVAVCLLTAYLSYKNWGTVHHMNNVFFWVFGATAVLFNPIVKIQLQREVWMIIDVALVGLFSWLSYKALKAKN